jgi:tRNA threonylcarbamoyladenosine biosynthesis protein TsaE
LSERVRTTSADETEALAARFSAALPTRDDAPVIIFLSGDLGAGKTTFAKGFLRGCGITEEVRSPTYALLEAYERPALTFLHLDLYRLRDPTELESLGLRDWALPGNVWLVEWPEKGGTHLPPADLKLSLTVGEGAHEMVAQAVSSFGAAWLGRVNTA